MDSQYNNSASSTQTINTYSDQNVNNTNINVHVCIITRMFANSRDLSSICMVDGDSITSWACIHVVKHLRED